MKSGNEADPSSDKRKGKFQRQMRQKRLFRPVPNGKQST